ncbi:MAG: hypothetical protein GY699_09535 [Desulfobacteraceae bacterium]|nr:hypothetical protein [Desulfobacteraceae bacterium]
MSNLPAKPFYKLRRFWILLAVSLIGVTEWAPFLSERAKGYIMKLLIFLPFILLIVLAGSCTTTVQKLDPLIFYKRDIRIEYKGDKYYGIAVLPYAEEYKIKLKAHGDMDYFSVNTFHREEDSSNPGGMFFQSRTTLKYKPTLEKEGDAPLYISVYNKKKKHGWAFIAFEHPMYTIESLFHCNGKVKIFKGVSACGTREGLKQKITFKEDVMISNPSPGPHGRKTPCPDLKSNKGDKVGEVFEFDMPNRICKYTFVSMASEEMHSMYLLGHEDSIVRD